MSKMQTSFLAVLAALLLQLPASSTSPQAENSFQKLDANLLINQLLSLSENSNRTTRSPNLIQLTQQILARNSSSGQQTQVNLLGLPITPSNQQPAARFWLNSSLSLTPKSTHNLSLASARQKWRHMESSMSESLNSLSNWMKSNLKLLDVLSVSMSCKLSLAELAEALSQQKIWASQMLDASAKLPSGLLEGTLSELGNFDECLAIEHQLEGPTGGQPRLTRGQYCSLQVKPPMLARPRHHTVCQRLPALSASSNQTSRVFRLLSQNSQQFLYVGLRLGLCTPDKCSQGDIQTILSSYLSDFELQVQVKSCQTRQESLKLDLVQQCIV